jgi:hypothetical protein
MTPASSADWPIALDRYGWRFRILATPAALAILTANALRFVLNKQMALSNASALFLMAV